MAEPKTRPTTASVAKFIAAQPGAERRADCETLARLLAAVTKARPVMWGAGLVGFGSAPVRYADGSTMDWPLLAFASRASGLVLYNLRGADDFEARLAAVGGARLKGGCVHLKRLADADARALRALLVAAVKGLRAKTATA